MSKNKLSYWKNHPGSAILRLLVWLSAIITVAVMAFLVGFILIKGVGNLTPDLFALEYNSDNASLMPGTDQHLDHHPVISGDRSAIWNFCSNLSG